MAESRSAAGKTPREGGVVPHAADDGEIRAPNRQEAVT